MMALVADHLWQSTLFAALAGLLTLALRKNRPQVRYAVWLAASLKFLVPVAALAAVGARFGSRSPAMIAGPPLTFVVDSWDALSQPFSRPGAAVMQGTISTIIAAGLPILLLAVWFCGCAAILATCAVRWRRIAATVRTAPSIAQGREVDTLRRLEADRRRRAADSPRHVGHVLRTGRVRDLEPGAVVAAKHRRTPGQPPGRGDPRARSDARRAP
jgi:hypothetical protein